MSADGLRHHDEVLVMLTRRNLLALAWYDAPRPGHLPAVQRVVEDLHRTHGKYGLLDVVVRGTPSFPDQVREEGRRLIETTHGWGGVTSHIIEVEGFAGTATRMFLSTMLLMGRGRASDQTVFARAPEGCAWLSNVLSRAENPWPPAELERVYVEVRSIAPR
jgi:hypothetical protein